MPLAGLNCTSFWAKRGYTDDVELSPQQWGLLQDPFGNSQIMMKRLSQP